jgi:hypothetical protein
MKSQVGLSLALGLALIIGAHSEVRADRIGGGFKAGLNIATLGGADAEAANVKSINGAILGAYLRIAITNQFSIQPEFLFSRNGAKADTLGITGTIKLNYFEAPLLFRYGFQNASNVTPSIFAGPVLSGRLSADAEAEVAGIKVSTGLEDEVKPLDFGLVFGGELGVLLGRPELTLEVRYKLGLTSIDDTGSNGDIKNRVFSVLIGIYFGPGGD